MILYGILSSPHDLLSLNVFNTFFNSYKQNAATIRLSVGAETESKLITDFVKKYIFVESVVDIDEIFILKCDLISIYDGYQKYNLCVAVTKNTLLIWILEVFI